MQGYLATCSLPERSECTAVSTGRSSSCNTDYANTHYGSDRIQTSTEAMRVCLHSTNTVPSEDTQDFS